MADDLWMLRAALNSRSLRDVASPRRCMAASNGSARVPKLGPTLSRCGVPRASSCGPPPFARPQIKPARGYASQVYGPGEMDATTSVSRGPAAQLARACSESTIRTRTRTAIPGSPMIFGRQSISEAQVEKVRRLPQLAEVEREERPYGQHGGRAGSADGCSAKHLVIRKNGGNAAFLEEKVDESKTCCSGHGNCPMKQEPKPMDTSTTVEGQGEAVENGVEDGEGRMERGVGLSGSAASNAPGLHVAGGNRVEAGNGVPIGMPPLPAAALKLRERVCSAKIQRWWKMQSKTRAALFESLVAELMELRNMAALEVQRAWRDYRTQRGALSSNTSGSR